MPRPQTPAWAAVTWLLLASAATWGQPRVAAPPPSSVRPKPVLLTPLPPAPRWPAQPGSVLPSGLPASTSPAGGKVALPREGIATLTPQKLRVTLLTAPQVPEELAVSPDGRWIAITLRSLDLRADCVRRRLVLLPTAGGEVRELASQGEQPCWWPDSRHLAFVSDREEGPQLWWADVETRAQRRLTRWPLAGLAHPQVAPDGRDLLFEAPTLPEVRDEVELRRALQQERQQPYHIEVWARFPGGQASPERLQRHRFALDPGQLEPRWRDLTLEGAPRQPASSPPAPALAAAASPTLRSSFPGSLLQVIRGRDGSWLARARAVGRQVLLRQQADGVQAAWQVLSGDWHAAAIAAGPADTAYFVGSSSADPPEVYAVTPRDAAPRRLSHFNDAWCAGLRLPRYRAMFEHAADGQVLPGFWLGPLAPPRRPVLLVVRGAPEEAAVDGWDDMSVLAQSFVASGCSVLQIDPRATTDPRTGRHRHAPAWYAGDAAARLAMADVMTWLVALGRQGVPAQDVAIFGEGLGAWLVLLAADRLDVACCITQGGVFDLPGAALASRELGTWDARLGAAWSQHLQRLEALSPRARVTAARLPHLVLHASEDQRVPVHEARALFGWLRRGESPARLLVFEGEGRVLQRPLNLEARITAMREWLARFVESAAR